MKRYATINVFACAFVLAGCGVDIPFDPANVLSPVEGALEDAQRDVENAIEDPLGSKPFPILLGGDSERVLYATNLGDVRFNFPGPTNDYVWPGFFGPSNVYQYADKTRTLIGPLVPAGDFLGFATDGAHVAYVERTDAVDGSHRLVATDFPTRASSVLFTGDSDGGASLLPAHLGLDNGRVVFAIYDAADNRQILRIEDLSGLGPRIDIEADAFGSFALLGDRLAYVERTVGGSTNVVTLDLRSGETTVVSEGVRAFGPGEIAVAVAPNRVVWSEPTRDGLTQVLAYDFIGGTGSLLLDAVDGDLAGASDTHVLTEERVDQGLSKPEKIIVRKYDLDGRMQKLADFRAEGRAGQARVIGSSAAWVNHERRIVLAPLAGGDRTSFRPFD